MTRAKPDRRLLTWSLAATATGVLFGVLSVVFFLNMESMLAWGRDFYVGTDAPRFPWFAERIEGGALFLPLLSGTFFLWAVALTVRVRLSSDALSICGMPQLGNLGFSTAALLVLGMSLWSSNAEWIRFGRPCWDQYCDYATLVSSWLYHRDPSTTAALVQHMGTNYHANSPLVPVLVASVMHLGVDVVTSYRLCCGVATLATAAILWRILKKLLYDTELLWASLFLFWTNMAVVRSFVFPQTDAVAMLWAALLIYFSMRYLWEARRSDEVLILVTLTSGLFVKVSLLPMIAAPFVWFVLAGRLRGDNGSMTWMSLGEVLMLTVIPLAAYLLFQATFHTSALYQSELELNRGLVDSFIPFVAISFTLCCGIFAVLAFVGRRTWTRADAFVFAWIVLYLGSLWISRAAGWNRYYLPVLPAFTIVGARGLTRMREEAGSSFMWVFVLGVVLLNYLGLWLRVYY